MENKITLCRNTLLIFRDLLTKKLTPLLFLTSCLLHVSAQENNQLSYVPGQIFIKYKDHIASRSFIPAEKGIVKVEDVPQIYAVKNKYQVTEVTKPFYRTQYHKAQNTYLVKFTNYDKVEELIVELESDPAIDYAEKVAVQEFDVPKSKAGDNKITALTPNDPLYGDQWHLAHINCPQAWDIVKGDDVVVAVLDGFVDQNHTEFPMWNNPGETPGNDKDDDDNGYIDDIVGYNFWDGNNSPAPLTDNTIREWHGTHVAGCAVAKTNNGKLFAAPGFNAKLMALAEGGGTPETIEGIYYAADNGADVLNMSIGYDGNPGQSFQDAVTYAWNAGVVVVATAGNGSDGSQRWPCSYDNVICVANTDANDVKAGSSQYHATVDMCSPGQNILSAMPLGNEQRTSTQSGTSMAAPVLSGVVALMVSAFPHITPDEVEECLKSTAVDIYQISANQAYQGKLGAGRVDALAAVECALSKSSGAPIARFSANETSGCGSLTVQFTDESILSPTSWSWDFGDGSTSTDQNPSHTYASPGTYTVELTVSNEYGDNTMTQTDYIDVGPGEPYAPEYVGKENREPNNGGYHAISEGQAAWVAFSVTAPLTFKSMKVYAESAGNRQFWITIGDPTTTNYQILYDKIANIPAGESRVNFDFDLPAGDYYLVQGVTPGTIAGLWRDQGGASYPYTIDNVISITGTFAAASAPNNWYFGYDWEIQRAGCDPTAISVVENTEPDLKVYPNPVNNLFTIELAERQESVQVKLYNMIGEVVYEESLGMISGPVKHQVNLANLPSGNYLLHITTGDKAISRKIIKE